MRYIADHDYHIHSKISLCSNDPLQTNENILKYASDNKLNTVILTDHYWDEAVTSKLNGFYQTQNYNHIAKALPLPQADDVRFLFGCETDLDKNMTLGIAPESFDRFAFVIIPTTHLHMDGFTIEENVTSLEHRAELWVERFNGVLNMKLPFEKIGIAHLTCSLIAPEKPEDHIKVLDMISDNVMTELFSKAADRGAGIELNFPMFSYNAEQLEHILRVYRIAKNCGCKFYFGSDAHHPGEFAHAKEFFERTVDILKLQEKDKFSI